MWVRIFSIILFTFNQTLYATHLLVPYTLGRTFHVQEKQLLSNPAVSTVIGSRGFNMELTSWNLQQLFICLLEEESREILLFSCILLDCLSCHIQTLVMQRLLSLLFSFVTENEYWPRCRWGTVAGEQRQDGSFHSWINKWVAGKTDRSLIRAILSALEVSSREKALYKSPVFSRCAVFFSWVNQNRYLYACIWMFITSKLPTCWYQQCCLFWFD